MSLSQFFRYVKSSGPSRSLVKFGSRDVLFTLALFVSFSSDVYLMEVSIHRAGPVSRVTKMTIHRASPVSNKNDYTQGLPCVKHRVESIS